MAGKDHAVEIMKRGKGYCSVAAATKLLVVVLTVYGH